VVLVWVGPGAAAEGPLMAPGTDDDDELELDDDPGAPGAPGPGGAAAAAPGAPAGLEIRLPSFPISSMTGG